MAHNETPHKVFPLTFLYRVSFALSFSKMEAKSYELLGNFIKDNLGVNFTAERINDLTNRPLFIGNEDQTVKWEITEDYLGIKVMQEAYRSFNESLLPLIRIVAELVDVLQLKVKKVVLEKVNLIPVTLTSYNEMGENAVSVFSEKLLRVWNGKYFANDDNSLLYLSKEAKGEKLELECVSGFISKGGVEEDQPSRYILDLTSRYDVKDSVDNLEAVAIEMNNLIFSKFTDAVTYELIQRMEDNK